MDLNRYIGRRVENKKMEIKPSQRIKKMLEDYCLIQERSISEDEVKMKCTKCGKCFLVAIGTASRDIAKFGGSKCVCRHHSLFPMLNQKSEKLGKEWLEDIFDIARRK